MLNPKFSIGEYELRLAKTRESMAQQNLDLLLVVDPSNITWLTGYEGWSFYVHQCVLISLDKPPIWFGREMDAQGARLTCYMAHDNIVGYEDNYVQSTERHPMDALSKIIDFHGWGRAQIGVEMDNYYYTAAAHGALLKNLNNAKFLDATALVNWQRAIKSETEILYMEKAAQIVTRTHQKIASTIEVGMRKCDLAADIYDASLRYKDGIGGDYAAIVPLMPSGKQASAPHLTWDEQEIKENEGIFFEIAGCYNRYHCPLSRTIYMGRPPQKFLDAETAVLEAMQVGLLAAVIGNKCEDIAIAFFDELARHGIEKNSRTGYSIGLSYPPDWGERTMSLRRGDKTPLRENMVFHFMSGIWMEDWGIEITESIVIEESGARCLASVPRELLVKD